MRMICRFLPVRRSGIWSLGVILLAQSSKNGWEDKRIIRHPPWGMGPRKFRDEVSARNGHPKRSKRVTGAPASNKLERSARNAWPYNRPGTRNLWCMGGTTAQSNGNNNNPRPTAANSLQLAPGNMATAGGRHQHFSRGQRTTCRRRTILGRSGDTQCGYTGLLRRRFVHNWARFWEE